MRFSEVGPTRMLMAFIALFWVTADISADEGVPTNHNKSSFDNLFLHDANLRLYWPPRRGCGVVAAYVTLSQMGHAVVFQDVVRDVPISTDGTTMAELAQYLKSQGVDVEAVEIDHRGLLKALSDNPDCHAIAWFDEDHWVAVRAGNSSDFAYYEYPKWHEASLVDFQTCFSGRALFVREAKAGGALRFSYWLRLLPWLMSVTTTVICVCFLFSLVREHRTLRSPNRLAMTTCAVADRPVEREQEK